MLNFSLIFFAVTFSLKSQINNGGCSISPKVDCINTRGSSRWVFWFKMQKFSHLFKWIICVIQFRCGSCPFGFEGDGRTCTASLSSQRPNSYICSDSSICNANAICYQYPNQPISCICKSGFTGNGFGEDGCVAVPYDPCALNRCRNGGTCVRNGTTFSCLCPPGTIQPYCTRETNYCFPNPCLNGGNCTQQRIGNRFRCSCSPGFKGNRCQTYEIHLILTNFLLI